MKIILEYDDGRRIVYNNVRVFDFFTEEDMESAFGLADTDPKLKKKLFSLLTDHIDNMYDDMDFSEAYQLLIMAKEALAKGKKVSSLNDFITE